MAYNLLHEIHVQFSVTTLDAYAASYYSAKAMYEDAQQIHSISSR